LFFATIGGLGLTGLITAAKVRLAKVPSMWIESETIKFGNLSEFFSLSKDSVGGFESSVGWFDCSTKKAGRGSFLRGNHVVSDRGAPLVPSTRLSLPVTPPFSLVNRFTLDILNATYFQIKALSKRTRLESMWSFYYPLDEISNWNRAYGPKGFFQYQSVVPLGEAQEATSKMLKEISKSGLGSFLAVLKTFGSVKSEGILSFPREGVTLALDFPYMGDTTEKLFDVLDRIVIEYGGRLNPSKDARMPPWVFKEGFPMFEEFQKFRDPGISSGLSRRLLGW
jgi:FAD/FMN-containing dehydrogenase